MLACVQQQQQQPRLRLWRRCCNISLKQDKWCIMWLAVVRLFIVRFKGQAAVSNYAPSRAARCFNVGDSSAWSTWPGKDHAFRVICHLTTTNKILLPSGHKWFVSVVTAKISSESSWHWFSWHNSTRRRKTLYFCACVIWDLGVGLRWVRKIHRSGELKPWVCLYWCSCRVSWCPFAPGRIMVIPNKSNYQR